MAVVVGRYTLFDEIASGGMATVYLGRVTGGAGFARTVAIKRLHPGFAKDPDFTAMLLDEARVASRIRHPNVVAMLDVVQEETELCLVMEYVHGLSLSQLMRGTGKTRTPIPTRIAATIVAGMLHGLHAAHEATDEAGEPLGIVHRDVSPQNILVGVDGTPRVVDFGIAKASGRLHTTREGTLKGKIPYMSPEQIDGGEVDRRTDIYAATVVLYECLVGRPLFRAENEVALIKQVMAGPEAITLSGDAAVELGDMLMRGLAKDRENRCATAKEMAVQLERAAGHITATEISEWMESVAGPMLRKREALVRRVETNAAAPVATPPPSEDVSIATKKLEPETDVWPQTVQETHVSVGRDIPRAERTPSRRRLWIALGVAAVAGGIAVRLVTAKPSSPPSAAATPSASPAPSATPSAGPPPAATVVHSSDVAPPAPSSTPVATVRPTARTVDCNPPWVEDPVTKIKRVKKGCGQ